MMPLLAFAVQATVWLASNYTAASFGTGLVSVIIATTMRFMSRPNEPQAFFGAPIRRRKSWTEWMASCGLSLVKNMGWMVAAFCFLKWPLTSTFMTVMWTGILCFSGLPSTTWVFALMFASTLLASAMLADVAKGLLHRGSTAAKKTMMSIIKWPFKLLVSFVCAICCAFFRRRFATFKSEDEDGYYTAEEDYASDSAYFTQSDGFWSDEDSWDGYDSDMTSENYEDDCLMADDESMTVAEPQSPFHRRSPRNIQRVDYTTYY